MHVASDIARDGQQQEHSEEQPAGASSSRESEAHAKSPDTVASPPTAPASPWWTAPGGKAVDIPDFGHVLFAALRAMLAPAPRPLPIRVRTRRQGSTD